MAFDTGKSNQAPSTIAVIATVPSQRSGRMWHTTRIPSGKAPVERAIETGRRLDDILGFVLANAALPRSEPEPTGWALSMTLGVGSVGDKLSGELTELRVGIKRKAKCAGDVERLLGGETRLLAG